MFAFAGITLGNKKHALVIALDANWSPGTYARRVVIGSETRNRFEVIDGAFGAGITLAYYLPIFDLN